MAYKICKMEIRGRNRHDGTIQRQPFLALCCLYLHSVWFSVPHPTSQTPSADGSQCLDKSPWHSTNGFSVTFFFGDNRSLVHKVLRILRGWEHRRKFHLVLKTAWCDSLSHILQQFPLSTRSSTSSSDWPVRSLWLSSCLCDLQSHLPGLEPNTLVTAQALWRLCWLMPLCLWPRSSVCL